MSPLLACEYTVENFYIFFCFAALRATSGNGLGCVQPKPALVTSEYVVEIFWYFFSGYRMSVALCPCMPGSAYSAGNRIRLSASKQFVPQQYSNKTLIYSAKTLPQ